MQTVRVREKTGRDGVLHLRIPIGQADAEIEAVVVLQLTKDLSRTVLPEKPSAEALGWSPGYFERTFGSITDDTFDRPPQGEFSPPVVFE